MLVMAIAGWTAGPCVAQSITQWRAPDGKIYFGDAPPAGSTLSGQPHSPPPMGSAAAISPSRAMREPPPKRPLTQSEMQQIDREVRGTWDGMNDALTGRRPPPPTTNWR